LNVLLTSSGDFEIFLTSSPKCTWGSADAKHRKEIFALGDEAEPLKFYKSLRNCVDQQSIINAVNVNDNNVRNHSNEGNTETIETEEEVPQDGNSVCENSVHEKVPCFSAKFQS